MFFSLGLTADAAAAHSHEFSSSKEDVQSVYQPRTFPIVGAFPESISYSPSMTSRPTSHISIDDITSGDEHLPTSPSNSRPVSGRRISSRTKPKTVFQLAHPPPPINYKQRLRLRPKILLQLHEVSGVSRPTPVLDVLPSRIFASRMANRFPKIFRGKDGLGPNDLIVVSSDSYEADEDDSRSSVSDDDKFAHREVVATICQLLDDEDRAQGKVEICFNHGPMWEAKPLSNGSYEFVARHADGSRTVARWVLRRNDRRRSGSSFSGSEEKRFTFSIVNPNTRRHPVIASMTRKAIEVAHHYSSHHLPTSPGLLPESVSEEDYFNGDEASTPALIKTDEELRSLIVASGIWVNFRDGWSENFSYNDPVHGSLSCAGQPSSRKQRVPSIRVGRPSVGGSASETELNRCSLPTRSKTQNSGNSRTATPSIPASASPEQAEPIKPPKRTNSTGEAFINRVNNRRNQSAARLSGNYSSDAKSNGGSEAETSKKSSTNPSRHSFNSRTVSTGEDMNWGEKTPVIEVPKTGRPRRSTEPSRGSMALEPSSRVHLTVPGANEGHVKGKRWRKISNIMNFMNKKGSMC